MEEGCSRVKAIKFKDFTVCRNNACAYGQMIVAQVTERCVFPDDEKSCYLFLKDLLANE